MNKSNSSNDVTYKYILAGINSDCNLSVILSVYASLKSRNTSTLFASRWFIWW